MKKVLLTGRQWVDAIAPGMMDPDGWRRGDGVDLDTPIDIFEFLSRIMYCSMQFHNPVLEALSELREAERAAAFRKASQVAYEMGATEVGHKIRQLKNVRNSHP